MRLLTNLTPLGFLETLSPLSPSPYQGEGGVEFLKGRSPFKLPVINEMYGKDLETVAEYMEGKPFILRWMIDAKTIKDTQRYY